MCYTRHDRSLEEEARKLRAEDERRRRDEGERRGKNREKKPVTGRVKEMIGVK